VAVLSSLLDQVQDHLGRDEFSQAQASLEVLTKLMPLDESVHRSAGRTFLRGRRLEPAVSQLFLAHLLDPSDLKVTVELAVCCIQTGRGDLARELAESVLETVPADSLWALKASKVLSSLKRKR
jgi:Flp pilus assembly protein TadD